MGGEVMFIMMFVLLMLGTPIFAAIGVTGMLAIILGGTSSLTLVPQRMLVGLDSFPLLAIIFFMIAGELMLFGGLSKRLVRVTMYFMAGFRGSLMLVSIITCAMFGMLTGSSLATTVAVGRVMYPEMVKDGDYDKGFSITIQAVGGTLGMLIPPSTAVVIFGMLTNTSIVSLFQAILFPGIVCTILYCLCGYIIVRKRNMAVNQQVVKRENGFKLFMDAFWALLTPVIILGGIYSGIFTPTESAAIACLYAFVVGKFIYKEMTFKHVYRAFATATISCSGIMFLVSTATLFSHVLTRLGFAERIANMLTEAITSPVTFLLLVNVVFLIAGMFIDITSIQLLFIPLILPTASALGVNMIHFGAMVCANLCLATITPPFGAGMFVANTLDKSVKIETIFKEILPFCVTGVIGTLVIIFVPILSTWML